MEHNRREVDETQGLEEISLSDGNEEVYEDEVAEDVEGNTAGKDIGGEGMQYEEIEVNGVEDLYKINLNDLTSEELMRIHFPNVDVAFMCYNMYANVHGFAARKSKTVWNINGEMIQQTFLCNKEGHRAERNNSEVGRKREPKPTTRCGCLARCQVHVGEGGRWYIKYFNDVHNHEMMPEKYTGMLPAHRKMSEFDKSQMIEMRKAGIKTPHIYGFIASQLGGYDRVGFLKRDMYYEQWKDRKPELSDAKAALDLLADMQSRDDMLYWKNTIDEEGRLEHLFWCDGVGRRDFAVFGDVLAFDATYRKNRYMSPLVVFSGVNHHNMSIVFACAFVANETEKTYVWVLEQFVEAMGGKTPVSVITDGDVAMRNAIRRVFPNAHHRLCAWHLIRNATSNIKNPGFVSRFKQCMLGDFDVAEFNRKWLQLVADFNLEENAWVLELYQRRRMWATAYIRGNFFAGFRTTSRCEGLHSEFGKYVSIKNNLVEFLQHFFRWLDYTRYREVEADFSTIKGEVVLQTNLPDLERSAALVYTREVFLLFRPVLDRVCTCKVKVETTQTDDCFTYTVTRYRREQVWRVSFFQSTLEFKCTCQRLESLGIPCEHMVAVMIELDIVNMPDCVVLKRWTKTAKGSFNGINESSSSSRPNSLWLEYVGLVERCKKLTRKAYECGRSEYMRDTIEIVKKQTETIEAVIRGEIPTRAAVDQPVQATVRDPVRARSKGCAGAPSSSQPKVKKTTRKGPTTCGICGGKGHNRLSCHVQMGIDLTGGQSHFGGTLNHDFLEQLDDDSEYANIEMDVD